jgi:hypothetical protein
MSARAEAHCGAATLELITKKGPTESMMITSDPVVVGTDVFSVLFTPPGRRDYFEAIGLSMSKLLLSARFRYERKF